MVRNAQLAVSLVIPGRDCAATLARCLESVSVLRDSGQIRELIFVDDGSRDDSAAIARRYGARVITGVGSGPAAARNLGWRAATSDLLWFIDSDCVAYPDTLQRLVDRLTDPNIAGVGGSYTNLYPGMLLPTLIHEEIVARHRAMQDDVDFLATFNVLYRRSILVALGGFDESLRVAEDADFAFRVRRAGFRLRFAFDSKVGHHHPRSWKGYLKTQVRNGYYRVLLYQSHPTKMAGDSYAGLTDYLQPPAALASAAFLMLSPLSIECLGLGMLLTLFTFLLHLPLTARLVRAAGAMMTLFPFFGFVRSVARALGVVLAAFDRYVLTARRPWIGAQPAATASGHP